MAGVKKFLDFFVKVEPDSASEATLSEEELQKILADEAPSKGAPKTRTTATPSAPKGAASAQAGRPGAGAAPAQPSRPAGPPQQAPRVRDVAAPVVAQVTAPSGNKTPTGPGELPDFVTIYQLAKVPSPAHGYSIDKVETMLANPRLSGMAPSIKANSVLMALEVANVPIGEVIADAVARDKAIDEFEGWWAAKVAQLESEKRAENAAIEDEMNRYLEQQRARIRANNESVQSAQETFAQWLVQKSQEEQRLYNIVAPFVTENPITLNTGMHRAPAGLAGEAPFGAATATAGPGKKT